MKNLLFLLLFISLAGVYSCGSKSGDKTGDKNSGSEKREFGWREDISASDIPDFPVKGFIGGKEVQFAYINFENWRGSKDNVINFSLAKPEQNCGFIENFEGFTLMNKGAAISQGQWLKAKFADDPKSYQGSFKISGSKSNDPWNCALEIESIGDKSVKGKI
ncbi:MAG: hypothetical protein JNK43_05330, partial [Ignavibacteria bacterium]|nr:hypothetical protein [Ignavibacteria bacterium]